MHIYIHKNNQQEGPFDIVHIQEALKTGVYSHEDLAWKEGLTEWVSLKIIIGETVKSPHHIAPPDLPVEEPATLKKAKEISSKLNDKIERADHVLSRLLGDEQEAKVVEKIVAKTKELLTKDEEIDYVGVQRKPIVTLAPDAVVLTNRRFIIVRPKLMGMTFIDHIWRNVKNVHMSEQLLTATVTCDLVDGSRIAIDCIPKKQARKIYSIAQEHEERVLEERRVREMEEKRAAAGGVIIHSPTGSPAPVSASDSDDPLVALGKLKKLLEAGLLEQSDFDAKKKEILSRM
jgi:hypothetical protein